MKYKSTSIVLLYFLKSNYMRVDPQKTEFIYSYTFKLQSPSKYSPFDAIHLSRLFSTAQNSFWTRWFWCLLVFLLFFILFHLFHITIPFEDLFHPGKQQKLLAVRLGEQGGRGMRVKLFLVKNCWTLGSMWAGVLVSNPSWNGQTCWKTLQKKFTEAKNSLSQQCQLVHGYRWVSRTLT